MERLNPELVDYQNKTEFPFHIVPMIKELGIGGLQTKDFGGAGMNTTEAGAIIMAFSKWDCSVATFVGVHNFIGLAVIAALGDEEQRSRMLPKSITFDKICCFGLTEPDNGSDASSLKTNATKVEGGYLINGRKRWIGNATMADYINVWARNPSENNNIQCFVVEGGSKGLTCTKIENKYSLRMT